MSVDRRKRWVDKMKAAGNCLMCGQPAVTRTYCRVHANRANVWASKRWAEGKVPAEKNRARSRVWYAVKRGDVIRPSTCPRCHRSDAKVNAHHAAEPFDFQRLAVVAIAATRWSMGGPR